MPIVERKLDEVFNQPSGETLSEIFLWKEFGYPKQPELDFDFDIYTEPQKLQVVYKIENTSDSPIQNWLGETFLQWQWWLLIVLLLVPWFIWWRLVDKQKLNVILPFGLLIIIFNSFVDDLGTGSYWWFYPHKIIINSSNKLRWFL